VVTAEPSPDPAAVADIRWSAIAAAAGVTAMAAVVAARMVDRLVDVAGLALAAIALALLTAPVQRRLATLVGSAASIVATALATLAVIFGVGAAALTDLRDQIGALGQVLRDRLDGLQPGSMPARVASALRVDEAIAQWSGDVPTQVVTGQESGVAIGRQLMSVFFVVVLAAFLQASRRTLVNHAVSRWPRPPSSEPAGDAGARADVRRFLADVEQRGAGFARLVLAVGAVAAVSTAGAAALLGVPGALVLGLWVGAWCVVPSVGWFVACLPAAALVAVEPRAGTVVTLVVTLAVSVVGSLVRRRLLEPRGVRLGASVHVAAVAVGVAVGGMAGTFVAVMVAAVGVAATTCAGRPAWPAPTGGRRAELTWGGRRRTVRVPTLPQAAALFVAVAAGVAFGLAGLQRLAPAIAWILIGGFAAIALHRPADWIERRGLHPYAARAVVLTLVAVVIVASVLAGRRVAADPVRARLRASSGAGGQRALPVVPAPGEPRDPAGDHRPPWGTLLAALAGGAAAGVLGAVLLTLVGVVRIIRREMRRDDFPGTVVRRNSVPCPGRGAVALSADVAQLVASADGLHPAEGFLDSFAYSL
jgi:putative heme transporter